MPWPYPSPFGHLPAGVPVGSVVAYAGQIEPVSSSRNTAWSNSTCGPAPGSHSSPAAGCPVALIEAQGWMACDGRTLSVAKFPELAAALGNVYGGDDFTFNLPDYRGLFLRGVDAGAGMDPDTAQRSAPTGGQGTADGVGSVQCDALQTHVHVYQATTPAAVAQTGQAAGTLLQNPPPVTDPPNTEAALGAVASVSAFETRPKNVAVHFLIKCRP